MKQIARRNKVFEKESLFYEEQMYLAEKFIVSDQKVPYIVWIFDVFFDIF